MSNAVLVCRRGTSKIMIPVPKAIFVYHAVVG